MLFKSRFGHSEESWPVTERVVDGILASGRRAVVRRAAGVLESRWPTDRVLPIDFERFDRLFPHCHVVIHQGGVGKQALAFISGVPQFVTPLSVDHRYPAFHCIQNLDGHRAERVECGYWARSRPTPQVLAQVLDFLLNLLRSAEQVRAVGGLLCCGSVQTTEAEEAQLGAQQGKMRVGHVSRAGPVHGASRLFWVD